MQDKERSTPAARGPNTVLETGRYDVKDPGSAEGEYMVDIALLVMVIASAVSLIVVSPRQARQATLRALRGYDDTELLQAPVPKLTADAGQGTVGS